MTRSSKFQSSVVCAGSLIRNLKLQAARRHRTQHLRCQPLGRARDGNPRRILHRILHHILQKILQKTSSRRSARNGQRLLLVLDRGSVIKSVASTASRKLPDGGRPPSGNFLEAVLATDLITDPLSKTSKSRWPFLAERLEDVF